MANYMVRPGSLLEAAGKGGMRKYHQSKSTGDFLLVPYNRYACS